MRVSQPGQRPSEDVPVLSGQLARPAIGLVSVLLAIGVLSVGSILIARQIVSSSGTRDADLRALADTNSTVLQALTDAESSVRGYALTGDQSQRRQAESFVQRAETAQTRLGDLADGESDLSKPVNVQGEAISAWVSEYAEPSLKASARADDDALLATGDRLFSEVRKANGKVADEIGALDEQVVNRADVILLILLAFVVLTVAAGIAVGVQMARRLSREMLEPLTGLAAVLDRLRAGDSEARAEIAGPQEVRDIASALNILAEENLRGRDVEVDVLSRLQELDRVRNDLVSTVSHELRTPLTSIKGYLELLQDQLYDDLSEMQISMMGVIRRNLDRLTELISNLLALSRAEETTLSIEPLDLRGVAAEVASDVRVTAAGRDISVRTVLPGSPVIMMGDRSQLLRAVLNLASNAVKFSRPGGTVELRVHEEGPDGLIEVVDEGIGIPAADLPALGSRFYRASNAVKAEIAGTGLGLRIVQTILDHHEGTLSVESVEGEGTTAIIRLPLRRSATVFSSPAPGGHGQLGADAGD